MKSLRHGSRLPSLLPRRRQPRPRRLPPRLSPTRRNPPHPRPGCHSARRQRQPAASKPQSPPTPPTLSRSVKSARERRFRSSMLPARGSRGDTLPQAIQTMKRRRAPIFAGWSSPSRARMAREARCSPWFPLIPRSAASSSRQIAITPASSSASTARTMHIPTTLAAWNTASRLFRRPDERRAIEEAHFHTPLLKTHRSMAVAVLLVFSITLQAQEDPAASPQTEMQKWLADLDAPWQATFKRDVSDAFTAEFDNLKVQYRTSIQAGITKASDAGDLDGALALLPEQKRFAATNDVPAQDDAADPLPVKQLRAGWRAEIARMENDRAARAKALHA